MFFLPVLIMFMIWCFVSACFKWIVSVVKRKLPTTMGWVVGMSTDFVMTSPSKRNTMFGEWRSCTR